ncbi:hypothetical protein INS49_009376 [Diaporthe citri]|uniref:uncharacterized protein n=1 Tax=Diaporthe citri TaxID=83186 RepID=UPI001C815ADA|nr:uncharacterized protein INS49_009376 [Diaporthe citri]KAG6361152.1 hypothetical protein INS49_009376 [Diaporthe citri]
MAPIFNTTIVCNTTATCASALDTVQERYEDAERLSYILGALLGIVFLLFVCSPLIFNLPRERDDDYETSRAPPPNPFPSAPSENDGVEMQNLAGVREMPSPEQFAIDATNSTRSSLPDPERFRKVKVDGESFHVNNSDATFHVDDSDATRLAQTGVFRGAGDEQELARRCVDEAGALSMAGDGEYEGTSRDRIGTAV